MTKIVVAAILLLGVLMVLPAQEQAAQEDGNFIERRGVALRLGTTGIGLDAA